MTNIIFIGPFPEPINGQSLVTKKLFEQFNEDGFDISLVDTSSSKKIRIFDIASRVTVHLRAIFVLCCSPGNVYLSLNSNAGMWLSLIVAIFATARGKYVALHHHAFKHFKKPSIPMKLISLLPSRRVLHVVLGNTMKKILKERYGDHLNACILNNSNIIPREYLDIVKSNKSKTTTGHMSNLSKEKGCLIAIDSVIHSKAKGLNCRLILAGPQVDGSIKQSIESARESLGHDLEYWGPVYGKNKKKFFDDIDVFIFPSTYSNEAEPLVMLESLAAGVPVVAFDVGCIGEDLDSIGGMAINPSENFSEKLITYLTKFESNRSKLSENARKQFLHLLDLNNEQFIELKNYLMNSK